MKNLLQSLPIPFVRVGVVRPNHEVWLRSNELPRRQRLTGFTLIEMVMVIAITGIIGSMVAVFLKAPIQQYMDVSRRADMTDIADTALRRVGRDLRIALPNSVRVTNNGAGVVFLEYLETVVGGRYNSTTSPIDCMTTGGCLNVTTTGDLVTGAAGAASMILLDGSTLSSTARLVVYNQYNNAGKDCSPSNPSAYCAEANGGGPAISVVNGATRTDEDVISFAGGASHTFLPAGGSPQNRFQIVSKPVTYVCAPDAVNPKNGTLTRYWGYAIQPVQPVTVAALTSLVTPASATQGSALLATNVSACNFTYDPNVVAQRTGLVTMTLGISEADQNGIFETVNLYSATHVSNVP